MKTRKHHNNKGLRQIRNDKTKSQVKKIAIRTVRMKEKFMVWTCTVSTISGRVVHRYLFWGSQNRNEAEAQAKQYTEKLFGEEAKRKGVIYENSLFGETEKTLQEPDVLF